MVPFLWPPDTTVPNHTQLQPIQCPAERPLLMAPGWPVHSRKSGIAHWQHTALVPRGRELPEPGIGPSPDAPHFVTGASGRAHLPCSSLLQTLGCTHAH